MNNEGRLLTGTYEGELLDHVKDAAVVRNAKDVGRRRIYDHERKRYAEIASFEIIGGLLENLTFAFLDVQKNGNSASFKNRRLHELMGDMRPKSSDNRYDGLMRVCDFVAGMTDRFAVGMYRQVKGIALGGLTPAPHRI